MIDWNTYNARLNINGNNKRERLVNTTKRNISSKIKNQLSYKKVKVNNNDIEISISNTKQDNIKKFQTIPNTTPLTLGNYIEWNKTFWLITSIDSDDEIYQTGIIKQCNHLCHFQNNSPTILKYWGILEKPILKLDDGKILSSPSDKMTLFLPYNEDTKKLYIDKRLFIETGYDNGKEVPVIYQIKSLIHKTNFDKLLEISLERTTYNSDSKIDSIEHQIADYIPPETPPIPPHPELLTCEIVGSDRLKVVNREFIYSPVFYVSDGKTIDDSVIPIWNVELLPEQVGKVIWKQNERFIEIKCTDDKMIGTSFKIKLVDDKGLYNPIEKTVLVVSMFG